MKMTKSQLMGLIRHILTAAGGIAIAFGYIDEGVVESIIGAVMLLVGVAWSFWSKRDGQSSLKELV